MRPFCVLLASFLTACSNSPDWYAPPIQRQPLAGSEPNVLGYVVNMNDANADAYFVKDISAALEGSWRWTGKRPELKFYLDSVESLRFTMDFTIAGITFQQTGPVSVSFYINGNLLDTVRYAEPGEKHFSKPVPAAWLRSRSVNTAAAEADKVWVSKTDGAVLGFILSRAGFVP